MKRILLSILALLAITPYVFAVGAVRITLTSRSATGGGVNQGVARDATRFWTSAYQPTGPNNLRLSTWGVTSDLPDIAGGETSGRDCTNDAPGGAAIGQINGIYYHTVDGYLYVTANNFPALNSYLMKYDPANLAGGPLASYTLTSQAVEGVVWNATTGTWWVFYHSSTNIEERDTNFNLLATEVLNVVPGGTQFWNGAFWSGDMLYLNPHNENADDRIYIYRYSGGGFTFVNRVQQPTGIAGGAGQGMFLYSGSVYMVERVLTTTGNVLKCAFNPEPSPTTLLSALVEWWELDEASGNAIGKHAAKTLTETSGTIAQSTGPGGTGNSRDFELADTEWFARADEAALSLSGNQDMTVVTFAKAESFPGANMGVVSHHNSGITQGGYLLYTGTTSKFQFMVSPDGTGGAGNAKEAVWSAAASTATWYFVVGEHDAGADTIRISVGDRSTTPPVITTGYTGGIFDSTAEFQIGAFAAGANNFDGTIAKAVIFNRCLTDAEIIWLNNSGTGRTYAELLLLAATPGAKMLLMDVGK